MDALGRARVEPAIRSRVVWKKAQGPAPSPHGLFWAAKFVVFRGIKTHPDGDGSRSHPRPGRVQPPVSAAAAAAAGGAAGRRGASTPWRGGARTPSQVLFERFAEDAALPVNRHSSHFKRSARRNSWRNVFAPLRAIVFPICSLVYGIAGKKEKSAAYRKVARYWLGYIRKMPARWRLYRRRTREIVKMKFDVRTSPVVS